MNDYAKRGGLLTSGPGTCNRHNSARETGVMQELEKHNLTRITNAPAEFLIQF